MMRLPRRSTKLAIEMPYGAAKFDEANLYYELFLGLMYIFNFALRSTSEHKAETKSPIAKKGPHFPPPFGGWPYLYFQPHSSRPMK